MVREAEKPNLRAASCCNVEVVNGGGGLRRVGLASTALTLKSPRFTASRAANAMAWSPISRRLSFLPANAESRAGKLSLAELARIASTDQYSCGLNLSISTSRSTMMRSATDCTRPAEREPGSLRHKTGDKEKPTR